MRENTALFYGLTGCAAVAFACAIELVPELNSFFQLAPLPGDVSIIINYI
jgi:predicted cobalt transporter CbtA